MRKTPDETKKGLACCDASIYQCEDDCPYRDECRIGQGGKAVMEDALALIQQLQAENAQQARCIENMTDKLNAMNDEVAKLKAERDAAVEDLESYATVKCFACKYYEEELTEVPCNECKIMGNGNRDMFEWRGVQKD